MTTVYYTCSFVPPELITACGCKPVRSIPALQNERGSLHEGICPFSQAWLESLSGVSEQKDAIAVFSTACDQMRRAYDGFCSRSQSPAFLLNVPSTDTQNAFNYYEQELIRLKKFLCTLSGKAFAMSQLYYPGNQNTPAASGKHTKIALVGGPVPNSIREQVTILLEAYDSKVTLHATEDRFASVFTPHQTRRQTSLRELARHYFQLPAIWKRPNDRLYTWITEQVQEKHIDGVLLLRYVFCDLWHSSAYEFKRRLRVPLLEIDMDGGAELSASAVSRIQAFMETVAL